MRKHGANAVLVLCSFGLNCSSIENKTSELKIYNKSYIQPKCSKSSIIYKLLNNTEPGIIDGIISGDTKTDVHHWINDIPIMSTKDKARYINIMYLPFKKINNNYTLVKSKIKIEGPLPLCQKIFQNLKHCEKISKEDFSKSGDLVEYYWHSRRIELEPLFQTKFEKYYKEFNKLYTEKIVEFVGFDSKINIDNSGDSLLGNLFLDIIKNISQADFSIANTGMFKNEITPGSMSYIDITNMFYQSEKLCLMEITGNELLNIIKTVQVGKFAYYPTSGLKQYISIDKSGKRKITDVKIYTEVNNTFNSNRTNNTNNSNNTNLTYFDYVPINKDKTYIMASTSYLLSEESGDDFRIKKILRIIQKKYQSNKIKCEKMSLGELLVDYFQKKQIVNITEETSLTNKRIIINKIK